MGPRRSNSRTGQVVSDPVPSTGVPRPSNSNRLSRNRRIHCTLHAPFHVIPHAQPPPATAHRARRTGPHARNGAVGRRGVARRVPPVTGRSPGALPAPIAPRCGPSRRIARLRRRSRPAAAPGRGVATRRREPRRPRPEGLRPADTHPPPRCRVRDSGGRAGSWRGYARRSAGARRRIGRDGARERPEPSASRAPGRTRSCARRAPS